MEELGLSKLWNVNKGGGGRANEEETREKRE